VRKHLSDIKGGWLAAKTRASCRTFAISDVIGDDLSVIGSGPTVADQSTFADAHAVLEQRGGAEAFPPAVVEHVTAGMRGARTETPKPGDSRLARSVATVVGSRFDAMHGAAGAARERGYHTVVVDDAVQGEARVAGRRHLAYALEVHAARADRSRPLCIVSSGETTVTVQGHGRGGRNQEFALAVVEALAASGETVALASTGTDGVDGPTDAAGAIADATTLAHARAAGLAAPETYLDDNDSHAFFAGLGDLIHTGPTGTNVGDLQVILLA
jgi:hydroxypyruvate reductase